MRVINRPESKLENWSPCRRYQELGFCWFAKDNAFGDSWEDYNIRKELKKRLFDAGVPAIEIERKNDEIKIMIQCARPGMAVGRSGGDIKKLGRKS